VSRKVWSSNVSVSAIFCVFEVAGVVQAARLVETCRRASVSRRVRRSSPALRHNIITAIAM
jgi:hypothetical protein